MSVIVEAPTVVTGKPRPISASLILGQKTPRAPVRFSIP